MFLEKAHERMVRATNSMRENAYDSVVQEEYKAAIEIYARQMKLNQETAAAFLENHRKEEEMIFHQAIEIIDLGINLRNPSVVKCALELISTMRKSNPEFYNKYYDIRFGR